MKIAGNSDEKGKFWSGKRIVFLVLALVVVIGGVGFGAYTLWKNSHYEEKFHHEEVGTDEGLKVDEVQETPVASSLSVTAPKTEPSDTKVTLPKYQLDDEKAVEELTNDYGDEVVNQLRVVAETGGNVAEYTGIPFSQEDALELVKETMRKAQKWVGDELVMKVSDLEREMEGTDHSIPEPTDGGFVYSEHPLAEEDENGLYVEDRPTPESEIMRAVIEKAKAKAFDERPILPHDDDYYALFGSIANTYTYCVEMANSYNMWHQMNYVETDGHHSGNGDDGVRVHFLRSGISVDSVDWMSLGLMGDLVFQHDPEEITSVLLAGKKNNWVGKYEINYSMSFKMGDRDYYASFYNVNGKYQVFDINASGGIVDLQGYMMPDMSDVNPEFVMEEPGTPLTIVRTNPPAETADPNTIVGEYIEPAEDGSDIHVTEVPEEVVRTNNWEYHGKNNYYLVHQSPENDWNEDYTWNHRWDNYAAVDLYHGEFSGMHFNGALGYIISSEDYDVS